MLTSMQVQVQKLGRGPNLACGLELEPETSYLSGPCAHKDSRKLAPVSLSKNQEFITLVEYNTQFKPVFGLQQQLDPGV